MGKSRRESRRSARQTPAGGATRQPAAASGGAGAPPTGDPRYKTKICKHWQKTGHCRFQDKCLFAHGEHELRTPSRADRRSSPASPPAPSPPSPGTLRLGPRAHPRQKRPAGVAAGPAAAAPSCAADNGKGLAKPTTPERGANGVDPGNNSDLPSWDTAAAGGGLGMQALAKQSREVDRRWRREQKRPAVAGAAPACHHGKRLAAAASVKPPALERRTSLSNLLPSKLLRVTSQEALRRVGKRFHKLFLGPRTVWAW